MVRTPSSTFPKLMKMGRSENWQKKEWGLVVYNFEGVAILY